MGSRGRLKRTDHSASLRLGSPRILPLRTGSCVRPGAERASPSGSTAAAAAFVYASFPDLADIFSAELQPAGEGGWGREGSDSAGTQRQPVGSSQVFSIFVLPLPTSRASARVSETRRCPTARLKRGINRSFGVHAHAGLSLTICRLSESRQISTFTGCCSSLLFGPKTGPVPCAYGRPGGN